MLLLFVFFQMTSLLFTLKGQSCTLLVFLSMKHVTRKCRISPQIGKSCSVRQGCVAVRFLKQTHRLKGAEHLQRCYQRLCDETGCFFLEFETVMWNEFVTSIFVTVC